MKNLELLIGNEELARNVKIELTGDDLIELANVVASAVTNHPVKEKEEYLTSEEVCSLLKIDRTTLWRWQKSGAVKKLYFDRYKRSDIEKAMENV